MMQDSWSSLHNQGAATLRTDYTQLGIPNHTTYVGLNLHSDPPKRDWVQRHSRAQYISNPAFGHEGACYSHHLSTPSAQSAVHVIE
jgi:hypothetical protein